MCSYFNRNVWKITFHITQNYMYDMNQERNTHCLLQTERVNDIGKEDEIIP